MQDTDHAEINVSILRMLFKGLQAFEAFYESHGLDVVPAPDGQEWSLWDIQYLYSARTRLSPRQRQAIELFLYENRKESNVAQLMGIGANCPIAIYATNGLKRIIAMVEAGELPKFRLSLEAA